MSNYFLLALLVMFSSATAYANSPAVLTSCESSLDLGVGVTVASSSAHRELLSEECYTRHSPSASSSDYTFLKWSGHWNTSAQKYFAPVSSWSSALSASVPSVISAAGWRLPTIKELATLAKFSSHSNSADLSPTLANNWMIQQWLLRGAGAAGDGTGLLAKANTYLLSSTYGVESGGTERLMALNIHSGQIEAINAETFSASTVYVLKVKQEEPEWTAYDTKYSSKDGHCLTYASDVVDSKVKVSDCSATPLANEFKWMYEANTGFVRSKNQKCLRLSGTSNRDFILLAECTGADDRRWSRYSPAGRDSNAFAFESRGGSLQLFYVSSGSGSPDFGDVVIWNYSAGGFGVQSDWFVKE